MIPQSAFRGKVKALPDDAALGKIDDYGVGHFGIAMKITDESKRDDREFVRRVVS